MRTSCCCCCLMGCIVPYERRQTEPLLYRRWLRDHFKRASEIFAKHFPTILTSLRFKFFANRKISWGYRCSSLRCRRRFSLVCYPWKPNAAHPVIAAGDFPVVVVFASSDVRSSHHTEEWNGSRPIVTERPSGLFLGFRVGSQGFKRDKTSVQEISYVRNTLSFVGINCWVRRRGLYRRSNRLISWESLTDILVIEFFGDFLHVIFRASVTKHTL